MGQRDKISSRSVTRAINTAEGAAATAAGGASAQALPPGFSQKLTVDCDADEHGMCHR